MSAMASQITSLKEPVTRKTFPFDDVFMLPRRAVTGESARKVVDVNNQQHTPNYD